MNTYAKYAPNVFVAKCSEKHESGETIQVQTKYGKEHDCIVYNLVKEGTDGFFYYSIVRADGYNAQEHARRKREKLEIAAMNAEKKSSSYFKAANKDKDFLSLGEPIKIGHHSEKRHRKLFENAHRNMSKCVEFSNKSEDYLERSNYWANREGTINLSMPESLEFYEFELEKAIKEHEGLKNGSIPVSHSYSIVYANKKVKDLEKKVKLALALWG
jgi:hypothetical protein